MYRNKDYIIDTLNDTGHYIDKVVKLIDDDMIYVSNESSKQVFKTLNLVRNKLDILAVDVKCMSRL